MKHLYFILSAIIAITSLTGCKTNEANYKAAYMVAKEKSEEKSAIDGTIYDRIRKEAIDSRLIVDGDSIPLMTVSVTTVDDYSSPETVKQYSVVINQFKQIFNAKSQVDRLRTSGYPDALILCTAEPLYYVVAETVATPEEAAKAYTRILNDKSIVKKTPFPWVLKPSRFPVR